MHDPQFPPEIAACVTGPGRARANSGSHRPKAKQFLPSINPLDDFGRDV